MTTRTAAPTSGMVLLGRYVLDDRAGGQDGAPIWRATDTRLRRPVAVQLLAGDDPRVAELRAGALAAAMFSDRRALPVLDVGDDEATGMLAIISEWVSALGFGDYLTARRGDLMAPHEAAAVALEVAQVLGAAHACGLAHGRLRPNSLVVTDTGEVRLRGLGIAAALAGTDRVTPTFAEQAQADVPGVGAILYVGLTGRWPGHAQGKLPAAGRLSSGALPWPSRVVADVPAVLDQITARCLSGCTLPKGHTRFVDVDSVAAALTAATTGSGGRPAAVSRPTRARPRAWPRLLGVLTAVLLAGAIAAIGIALASGSVTRDVTTSKADEAAIGLGLTSAPPTATPPVERPAGGAIPIVSISDLDPYGSDQQENHGLVPLAVDGNPATAWTTLRYRRADMSGKPGVGLLVDLGTPRPVSSVRLVLVGNDTDVELLAGDRPGKAPRGFQLVASAIGAPTELTMRSVQPVTSRYLVVWLTKLPPSGNAYRGGVAEVQVFS